MPRGCSQSLPGKWPMVRHPFISLRWRAETATAPTSAAKRISLMIEVLREYVVAQRYLVVVRKQCLSRKLPQPLGKSSRYRDKNRHAALPISYTSQAIASCNHAAANLRSMQGMWSGVCVSPAMLAIAAAWSQGIPLELVAFRQAVGWQYISAYRFDQAIGRSCSAPDPKREVGEISVLGAEKIGDASFLPARF